MSMELDEKIAIRRHQEITDLLKGLKIQFNPKEDAELKELIRTQGEALSSFVRKVEELQKPQIVPAKNEINVTTDNKEIAKSLNEISNRIIASNEKLISKIDEMIVESKRGKKFDMRVNRNNWSSYIDSVNGTIT
jgi:hypothetical protein